MEIDLEIGIFKWKIWKKRKRLKVCNFNDVRLSQETTKIQKCPKEADAKMRKCKNAKLRKSKNTKFDNWLSPVSPGDDSGELVAAHEWTWQVGFNKNNPQFKKTHFPFFCLYLTTQFRQICLQG